MKMTVQGTFSFIQYNFFSFPVAVSNSVKARPLVFLL